jgi:hypothetical protein
MFNPLTPELNISSQRGLPRFLLRILIFKRFTARLLYKSFGAKGLNISENEDKIKQHKFISLAVLEYFR